MLNLSSPSEQILKEVFEEQDKAVYWHLKLTGKRLVQKQLQETYRRYIEESDSVFTGVTSEYVSPSGNKWFNADVFTRRRGEGDKLWVRVMSFIYYNTASSIGCFLPTHIYNDSDCRNGQTVDIFTSHFFQRYCDRADIKLGSMDMLLHFAAKMMSASYEWVTDNHGRHPVLRLSLMGVSLAVPRQDNPHVLEHRTFLADNNLNPHQKALYKNVIERGDKGVTMTDTIKGPKVMDTLMLKY